MSSTGAAGGAAAPAGGRRIDEPGNGQVDVFDLPADEATVLALLELVFARWWNRIRFGPIIQGAVYELRCPHRPELGMLDGYLTIGFDGWHVHVCIGQQRGLPERPVDPELARHRRTARAELARVLVDGVPMSWMVRLFNGGGEQQMTVLLPNPYLDDEQDYLPEPEWSNLGCWDELRHRFLGLGPDPLDRTGTTFIHP